jgi:hypothetical protein
VKKTLSDFLTEKKKAGIDHDVEERFKDLDCNCDLDEMDEDERDYCNQKRMIDFINRAYTVNS